jgi:hypothetical protein
LQQDHITFRKPGGSFLLPNFMETHQRREVFSLPSSPKFLCELVAF